MPDEAGGARKRKEHSNLFVGYCDTAFPAALRSHFKHDVVLARVLDHLQPEIVFCSHFSNWRVINLQGFNLLGEVGGVSPDVDYITNSQRSTRFELHSHDGKVAVIMAYDADALL